MAAQAAEAAGAGGRRRLRLELGGAVQGVGYRPFVYRIASELGVAGWIVNDPAGVVIEAESDRTTLQRFAALLRDEAPPHAQILRVNRSWLDPVGYQDFQIRASDAAGERRAVILPDMAVCRDCLADMARPGDRRRGYAFTNCTNCGPRFSIIRALPYDRPNTTMAGFTLCADCAAEYQDVGDRRFHAQPNACPRCGPRLRLLDADGVEVDGFPIRLAAAALRSGRILALKGVGGFHLLVDAGNQAAVLRLRQRKRRPTKPLAVMVPSVAAARELCHVPARAAEALTSVAAPIMLLRRRGASAPGSAGASPEAAAGSEAESSPNEVAEVSADTPAEVAAAASPEVSAEVVPPGSAGASPEAATGSEAESSPNEVAESVAPGNPYLGVMLPHSPLHSLLLEELGRAVVATSGNLSEEPICIDEAEALDRLGCVADLFLVHDRPIQRHVDDGVAWLVGGRVRLLRRARGQAPAPVALKRSVPPILAVGAQLKSAIALARHDQVFLSQHIGDLESLQGAEAFRRVIADFLRLYQVDPCAIAHDMHPDYTATHWARSEAARRGQEGEAVRLVPVQHHHAHLASCLAEHGLEGPALGIIWDGTGYGPDGTVWGGEFLLGDAAHYRRVAHLHPFRLPGGEAAVREPRRVALALLDLLEESGAGEPSWEGVVEGLGFNKGELGLLRGMLRRQVRSPVTTSAGRLFDGVAALLGLSHRVSYEGEAAIALEFAATGAGRKTGSGGGYPVGLRGGGDAENPEAPVVLDWRPALQALLRDLVGGREVADMARAFHEGLVGAMVGVAELVGVEPVVLSGGCFQNRLLTLRALRALRQAGFRVLLQEQVPPNDGGIALGQVAVAAEVLRRQDSE